jgi:hypothetical protein
MVTSIIPVVHVHVHVHRDEMTCIALVVVVFEVVTPVHVETMTKATAAVISRFAMSPSRLNGLQSHAPIATDPEMETGMVITAVVVAEAGGNLEDQKQRMKDKF